MFPNAYDPHPAPSRSRKPRARKVLGRWRLRRSRFTSCASPSPVRILALIAAYNEERFIAASLRHLAEQGLYAILLDHGSTDNTVEAARPFLGETLLQIQSIPRGPWMNWEEILRMKSRLQCEWDADWFLHMDPDEFRYPPPQYPRLADWVAAADAAGYTALNFRELTFLPTQEHPDHDHPQFRSTLRRYYPFKSDQLFRVNAWRGQPDAVDLAGSGGHLVEFPGRRISPEFGIMHHYLFLSEAHALEKYGDRFFAPEEMARGWHGWRQDVRPDSLIHLPPASEMRFLAEGAEPDWSSPRREHYPFLGQVTE